MFQFIQMLVYKLDKTYNVLTVSSPLSDVAESFPILLLERFLKNKYIKIEKFNIIYNKKGFTSLKYFCYRCYHKCSCVNNYIFKQHTNVLIFFKNLHINTLIFLECLNQTYYMFNVEVFLRAA